MVIYCSMVESVSRWEGRKSARGNLALGLLVDRLGFDNLGGLVVCSLLGRGGTRQHDMLVMVIDKKYIGRHLSRYRIIHAVSIQQLDMDARTACCPHWPWRHLFSHSASSCPWPHRGA
jgi:hypothetical protein